MANDSDVLLTAPVVYVQPEFEELKHWFQAFVHPVYKDNRFDPIWRCKAVSRENREVVFEYVYMGHVAFTDEVLAKMDCMGLRPALYEELLGFAKKYSDKQYKHPFIVALGSGVNMRGNCEVACLCSGIGSNRALNLCYFENAWHDCYWFLAVRE